MTWRTIIHLGIGFGDDGQSYQMVKFVDIIYDDHRILRRMMAKWEWGDEVIMKYNWGYWTVDTHPFKC